MQVTFTCKYEEKIKGNFKNERNNYEELAKLLEQYGDLRTVHKSNYGFFISDLYLNGDRELRLELYEEITYKDLSAEVKFSNWNCCVHPLFKSRQEVLEDKMEALLNVEEHIRMYVYEPTDDSFMEHADYILENVDFSKLDAFNYQEGVIKFLEIADTYKQDEFHFICRNRYNKDDIKKILIEHGNIKYVYRDDEQNICINSLFIDKDGNPVLECSKALTGKIFEKLFNDEIYSFTGEKKDFIEVLFEFSSLTVRNLKLNALIKAENLIVFERYESYNTEFHNFINYFFSKVNVNNLDTFNQHEGILDFIESSKKETFFITKF